MSAGRYNFEFHRCCHCGQTVSIYDTESCCDPKVQRAKREGKALSQKLSPTTKSLCRLLRRAKAHGIQPWHIIRMDHGGKQATVLFSGRHIRIRDDGSLVPDMLPRYTPEGGLKTDPQWERSMYARMYFLDMDHAAYCRRMHWIDNARRAVRDASFLRSRA